jgi:hypothetical protein
MIYNYSISKNAPYCKTLYHEVFREIETAFPRPFFSRMVEKVPQ